jgi:hypothetical protein
VRDGRCEVRPWWQQSLSIDYSPVHFAQPIAFLSLFYKLSRFTEFSQFILTERRAKWAKLIENLIYKPFMLNFVRIF